MEAIGIFLAFATYMNFKPPGFESEFLDYVCKLDKALYGLKQAPRAWRSTLVQVNIMTSNLAQHVYKLCKQFEKLTTKKFEMSMIGELTYFLGLQIEQDDKGISICQEQYTRNLLKKYKISDSSSVKTPMGNDWVTDVLDLTRPDIQFSISYVQDSSRNPKESLQSSMKRILMLPKSTSVACQILVENCLLECQEKAIKGYVLSLTEYVAVAGVVTKVDIGEIIYSDLVTKLLNKYRLKYVSYLRFISCALQVLLEGFSVTTSFACKAKKGKSQTVTHTLPKSQGLEVPRALSKNSKRPKSKRPPTKTKGTRKSKPLPESTATHPKDSGGNKQPLDRDITSITSDKGMAKTTAHLEGSLGDKDSGGNIPSADMEQVHPPVVDLLGTDVRAILLSDDESEEGVLGAGEEIDEEPRATGIEKHEEAAVNYADLKASINDYYDENIAHQDQTNKLAHALKQDEELVAWAKSFTNMAWNLSSRLLVPKRDKGKRIATESDKDLSKRLVHASTIVCPDPNALIPYKINGEVYHLTAKQLQEQMDKEELVKKDEEKAKLLAIFKSETINNRLKPETITDIKIHPKIKPVVITVYRGTDGRNFDVYRPFAFVAFGISELDELREIIPKKINAVVHDLMNSISRRYERVRKILEELRIKSALPAPDPE
ncbi:retrovirus-related pol polyprotein from transposon TNT 1-94 [Tanacetum coccineum]